MKTSFFSMVVLIALLVACDKVDQPVPKASGGLDWSLYPEGDSAHYAANYWPEFTQNTNTQRNVIIEDFTGHKCGPCYNTLNTVHNKVNENPEHIFAAAIHAGPSENGMTDYQQVESPYLEQFFNSDGLSLGAYLGDISGGFIGNPRLTINRTIQSGEVTCTASNLNTGCSAILGSALKVNIQATTNYFASTRGLFLHTEVEKIDATIANDLAQVVYLVEDSLISPQLNGLTGQIVFDYVHRDIMRGCIDHKPFGQKLDAAHLAANGKYYFNYSYKLPNQYNPDNMHLLIYVYDKVTNEIYQVIKHEL